MSATGGGAPHYALNAESTVVAELVAHEQAADAYQTAERWG